VEDVGVDPGFWRGRRVLVTGHAGFKGSWLTIWLGELGAEVTGVGIGARTEPSLYRLARVADGIAEHPADVRDRGAVRAAVDTARPEVVVHMAAQPLVRRSFDDPVETYDVNVMGTVNVLEALRAEGGTRVAIVVTSDKCYAPRADGRPCREEDPLGGDDPYSSSKAAAELVTAAYRRSFARDIALASVRAGNVIGGGDWAEDRLVPDAMRAALAGSEVAVRNPESVRPWQHVLNPLAGYLTLAERLWSDPSAAGAWNFGPSAEDELPVREVVERLCERWGGGLRWRAEDDGGPPETHVLRVDSTKARERLGWRPGWDIGDAIAATVDWFRAHSEGADARATCVRQIAAYAAASRE
jgi:CDP-glucose 4,6-dehydratase